MIAPEQYELLDFGDERKLERFGEVILDRPAPMAHAPRQQPGRWSTAWLRYDHSWGYVRELPTQWHFEHSQVSLELRTTPAGQVGVFVEQAENWAWIKRQLQNGNPTIPPSVLNLFAYTGGSTLAAAASGARVVHLDAAQNIIVWARANAHLSDLASAPIRWICDDAQKFVAREVRRENCYDAIVLDPPSYGHGPERQPWQIDEHLPSLLRQCGKLLSPDWRFVLLTCHTERFKAKQLQRMLADAVPDEKEVQFENKPMALTTASGHELVLGVSIRCHRRP